MSVAKQLGANSGHIEKQTFRIKIEVQFEWGWVLGKAEYSHLAPHLAAFRQILSSHAKLAHD